MLQLEPKHFSVLYRQTYSVTQFGLFQIPMPFKIIAIDHPANQAVQEIEQILIKHNLQLDCDITNNRLVLYHNPNQIDQPIQSIVIINTNNNESTSTLPRQTPFDILQSYEYPAPVDTLFV